MKEFKIDKNTSDMRLDKFLIKIMPSVGVGGVQKALRKKKVRVNGKHTDGACRLSEGDTVCVYMNDDCFDTPRTSYGWLDASADIDVAYEDENILVASKPSGMPSQESDGATDCLESRVRAYLYKKSAFSLDASPLFIPSLCHRIDRNTSGLVICAKNSMAQRIINQKIKNREIRKFYLCKTANVPQRLSGKICGWLVKSGNSRKMNFYTEKQSNGEYCETLYKVINKEKPCTIEAELLTGRTHQIRACLAHIGCPLIGDVKYGAPKDGGREYQQLTAYKLIFDFSTPSGELEYLKGTEIKKVL